MLNYLQINILSLFVLIIIYINIYKSPEKKSFDFKMFFGLIISTALLLIFDSLMVLIDGQLWDNARILNIAITSIYYILNPLPCFFWTIYCIHFIYGDKKIIDKILHPLTLPFMIFVILTLINIFISLLFYIDDSNIYHRGPLFFILVIVCYGYLLFTFSYIIKNKKRIPKNNFMPMFLFAIPPTIGGLIQTLHYGAATLWPCVTISILFIYTNIQNLQMHTDYLTGLFNRRQLDTHLNNLISRRREDQSFAGLMIDLNHFKKINDIYGHGLGDKVLAETGKLLKSSFRKDDFIARYGGDEFVIILEIKDESDLKSSIEHLMKNVTIFNSKKVLPFDLSFSVGYDIYNEAMELSIEQFLNRIDEKMYEDKQRNFTQ